MKNFQGFEGKFFLKKQIFREYSENASLFWENTNKSEKVKTTSLWLSLETCVGEKICFSGNISSGTCLADMTILDTERRRGRAGFRITFLAGKSVTADGTDAFRKVLISF